MNEKRDLDSEILRDFINGKLPEQLSDYVEDYLARDPQALSKLEVTSDDSFVIALRQAAFHEKTLKRAPESRHDNSKSALDALSISPKLAGYRFAAVLKCYGQVTTALATYHHDATFSKDEFTQKLVVRLFKANPAWAKEEVERFRVEVETLKSLEHPNIVTYFDSDVTEQTAYLAMRFIEGVDLAKLVAQYGPIPYGAVAIIAMQLLEALDYLNQQQVVHRDVKPSNIVLGTDGTTRLIDFGLAKRVITEQDHSLTRSEYFLGTLDYISPEQAIESRHVDIRSDLYSLGCTLYTLLTGHPPFSSSRFTNPLKKVLAHALITPTKIQQLSPDTPAELCEVIDKFMAKDPQNRFATPKQAAALFKAWSNKAEFDALLMKVRELEGQLSYSLWATDSVKKRKAKQAPLLPPITSKFARKLTWIGMMLVLLLVIGLTTTYFFRAYSRKEISYGINDQKNGGDLSITLDNLNRHENQSSTKSRALPLREGYYHALETNLRTPVEQHTGIIISGSILAYTTPDDAPPGQSRRVGCLWRRLEGHPLESEGKLIYAEEPGVQGYLIVECESSDSFRAMCWRGNDFSLEEAITNPSCGYFHSSIEGQWFSPDIRFAGPALQLHPQISDDWREFIRKVAPQCLP